jgi:hypothetical protein
VRFSVDFRPFQPDSQRQALLGWAFPCCRSLVEAKFYHFRPWLGTGFTMVYPIQPSTSGLIYIRVCLWISSLAKGLWWLIFFRPHEGEALCFPGRLGWNNAPYCQRTSTPVERLHFKQKPLDLTIKLRFWSSKTWPCGYWSSCQDHVILWIASLLSWLDHNTDPVQIWESDPTGWPLLDAEARNLDWRHESQERRIVATTPSSVPSRRFSLGQDPDLYEETLDLMALLQFLLQDSQKLERQVTWNPPIPRLSWDGLRLGMNLLL